MEIKMKYDVSIKFPAFKMQKRVIPFNNDKTFLD